MEKTTELVKRVEKHIIDKSHNLYGYCDEVCFASKNLYNLANYTLRQEFIKTSLWIRTTQLDKLLKSSEAYRALPAQTAQQTLRLLDKNWVSFFEANKSYKENPTKFKARPKLPKYKDKIKGRNIVIFTNQQVRVRNGQIKFAKSEIKINTKVKGENLCQVRIIPRSSYYCIEVVYEKEVPLTNNSLTKIASIDLGLNNLLTIVSNIAEPIVVKGQILKAINQLYHKEKARLMSFVGNKGTSNKINHLTIKRNNRVENYLHQASSQVSKYLKDNKIDTLVIGYNPQWKQEIELGKSNNQNFVSIPFARLIEQLEYKAQNLGIKVITNEESYTSKASFIDLDVIAKYGDKNIPTFSGKRIARGLYKTKAGNLVNADVNAAYNILRKVVPNAFANGIEGLALHPSKLIEPVTKVKRKISSRQWNKFFANCLPINPYCFLLAYFLFAPLVSCLTILSKKS